MKKLIVASFIFLGCCFSAFGQTHITLPDSAGANRPVTTVKKVRKHEKNLITKSEAKDSTHTSSDDAADNNRTLDRTDVNGGNNADINRGYPVGK